MQTANTGAIIQNPSCCWSKTKSTRGNETAVEGLSIAERSWTQNSWEEDVDLQGDDKVPPADQRIVPKFQ
jgi:hypothetical protein